MKVRLASKRRYQAVGDVGLKLPLICCVLEDGGNLSVDVQSIIYIACRHQSNLNSMTPSSRKSFSSNSPSPTQSPSVQLEVDRDDPLAPFNDKIKLPETRSPLLT